MYRAMPRVDLAATLPANHSKRMRIMRVVKLPLAVLFLLICTGGRKHVVNAFLEMDHHLLAQYRQTPRPWVRLSSPPLTTTTTTKIQMTNQINDSEDHPTSSRRLFLASTLVLAAGSAAAGPALAADLPLYDSTSSRSLPWETNPINKRSGVTAWDAEKAGYTVAFVTYLARFLLNFDPGCQQWWFSTKIISQAKTAEAVESIRLDQFAAFAASVEVGLQEYEGAVGPSRLLQSLLRKYGRLLPPTSDSSASAATSEDGDDLKRQRRLARSARRQIALLFGLLQEKQPVEELTKLLASVDNGSIASVQLLVNDTSGVLTTGYERGILEPTVEFPPPQAGPDQGGEQAEGRVELRPTGRLRRLQVVDSGHGYTSPPTVTVSPPRNGGTTATAKAKFIGKGSLVVELTDPGAGYTEEETIQIQVSAPPPESEGARTAMLKPVLDMAIDSIEITKGGSGYAVEKPLNVYLTTTTTTESSSRSNNEKRVLVGTTTPRAEKSSFTSFRKESDTKTIRDLEEKVYKVKSSVIVSGSASEGMDGGTTLPFWTGKSSSSELLRLLPAGVGLEYDPKLKRYVLAVDSEYVSQYPGTLLQSSNRPIGPEFGPRGRSPIERDMDLGTSTLLRFCASGAICASVVHTALTPIDVVKTKVQTDPVSYPSIGKSFQTVWQEGFPVFFTGWLPTFLSNFAGGGVLYALVEFVRRSLSDAAGVDAIRLEVPIILVSAGLAAAVAAVLNCPFEAVRIRTVANPDYGRTSVDVLSRIVEEEGVTSLFNAVPIFVVKNVPYAMTKFLVFDLSTEKMYAAFPAAQEELKLSLLVSLIGGILGGTAAAVVSNPADAVISEMKRAKSDVGPYQALTTLLDRNGIPTLFKGLQLRIVFYSLIASLTFVAYDAIRFALGVGPDDLKLYLDVLGGALRD